jgi:hypothetical protein
MKSMPRNEDISNWDHGLVLLNKNSVGLDPNENYRTKGNDPGKKNMAYRDITVYLNRLKN